jgi:hypothetical protein
MREVVFALTFRGKAGAAPGSSATRQARTVAPSQALRTVLSPMGIDSRVELVAGESAVLESRVERFGDGTFVEDGTIAYGSAGTLSFVTVGRGTVGPSPIPGWVHGAVVWSVTSGTGYLAGATGLITSNFVASADGDVVDQHVARLYLPG